MSTIETLAVVVVTMLGCAGLAVALAVLFQWRPGRGVIPLAPPIDRRPKPTPAPPAARRCPVCCKLGTHCTTFGNGRLCCQSCGNQIPGWVLVSTLDDGLGGWVYEPASAAEETARP
jgi:hypothetical protein